MGLVDHWPMFGLRVHTPRLELRYPTDEIACALAELALDGIHDPATMPFSYPWTDIPAAEQARQSLVHHWTTRVQWTPDDWHCPMAVFINDELVGVQAILGHQFASLRAFKSGSWLGQAHQGKGIGKEMRSAILHLGFVGLDAQLAFTSAYHDNAASLGVTRALGYLENGWTLEMRRDKPDKQVQFVLPREVWEQRRRDDIEIEGLRPCLALFGAA